MNIFDINDGCRHSVCQSCLVKDRFIWHNDKKTKEEEMDEEKLRKRKINKERKHRTGQKSSKFSPGITAQGKRQAWKCIVQ